MSSLVRINAVTSERYRVTIKSKILNFGKLLYILPQYLRRIPKCYGEDIKVATPDIKTVSKYKKEMFFDLSVKDPGKDLEKEIIIGIDRFLYGY